MNENEERVRRDQRVAELMGKTIPELQQILERETKEQLVNMIADLEGNVRHLILTHLDTIIGTAMGFDRSWGRWEVKSHNESPITRALGELALANIKLVMPDYIDRLHSATELRAAMEEGLRKDYDYKLRRKVSENLESWLTGEAKRQSDLIIASLKPPEKK